MQRVLPTKALAAVIFLALVAFAGAQEDALEMGCETYTDYWLCPQAKIVFNAPLEYTSDVECYELFGESLGCIGEARLLSGISFEECWIYIPLLPGNEVDFDSYQYDYDCRENSWGAGSVLNLSTSPELVSGCARTEGDDGYEVQSCATRGQRITANLSLEEEGGAKYAVVVNSVPYSGIYFEWWHWIVLVIAVIAIIWAVGKAKK